MRLLAAGLGLWLLAGNVVSGEATQGQLAGKTPVELIAIVEQNVDLGVDVVLRLKAQERLASLGKADALAVVPLIVERLAALRGYEQNVCARRIALIDTLRDIGPAAATAVPTLTAIVEDTHPKNEWASFAASNTLLRIGTPEAVAATDASAKAFAKAFAGSGTPDQIDDSVAVSAYLIRQQLRSRNPSAGVIDTSTIALRDLGGRALPAADTLRRAKDDPRLPEATRDLVAEALAAMALSGTATSTGRTLDPPDILTDAIADTRHPNALVQSLAITELGQMGSSPAAIAALMQALASGRSPGDAARVLGDFGTDAADAVPLLVRYFEDERAGTNAIQAVGRIGAPHPLAISKLRRIVTISGHRQRAVAASALANLDSVAAVPDIASALADNRKYIRIVAANALAQFGERAAPAISALAELVADPDIDVRRAGVQALGRIGPKASPAVAQIKKQLDSSDQRLKESASHALQQIGGAEADAAIARDAKRFAQADLRESERLRATQGTRGIAQLIHELPRARGVQLAHSVSADEDPQAAAVAITFLLDYDREAALFALTDRLARKLDDDDVLQAVLYSLSRTRAEDTTAILLADIDKHLDKHDQHLSPEERLRVEERIRAFRRP